MELNPETIAGIAVGGIAGIAIAKPLLYRLSKVAEPFEFGWIEHKINPKGRSYFQIVRENRKQLKQLDRSEYLDELAKRLVVSGNKNTQENHNGR